MKSQEDIARALRRRSDAIQAQRQALDDELKEGRPKLEAAGDRANRSVGERVSVKPRRTNVTVKLVGLMWTR